MQFVVMSLAICNHQRVVRPYWDDGTTLRHCSECDAAVLGPTCRSGIHPGRSLEKRVLHLIRKHPASSQPAIQDRLYGLFLD